MSKHERRQAPSHSKSNKNPRIVLLAIIAMLILALVAIFLVVPAVSGNNVGSLDSSKKATVVIESGDTAKDVAVKFKDAGLVADADRFVSKLTEVGADSTLIPGEYTFSGKTDTSILAQALKEGKRDEGDKVTVVEGYTINSISQAVAKASGGSITADSFKQVCNDASKFSSDYDFLSEVGNKSLEGFLLPKTYEIESSDTAETLVKKMLDQFKIEVSNLDFSYASNTGLNFYDAIKLASVVQKESPTSYHARVAGIFYNRLKSNSPYLQSDATTAYYVGHDPTGEEVHANNEYSTYTNPGLPPTPICNPSIDAIKSVCFPEENNYRYFYTTQNGQYVFSETFEQHQQAIENDTN